MNTFLHPDFKLNNESFTSSNDLIIAALQLVDSNVGDERSIAKFILEWLDSNEFISVKTSGSTGAPKTIRLHKKHVFNSAAATVAYFDLKEGTKALLCLPSEYIAGKMMLVRAMTAGWNLYTASIDKSPLEQFEENFDFTAMVPYQVHHSLSNLHKVKKMIIGGGAVSKKLEQRLHQVETEVFATYGMTETISHVAVRPINGEKKSRIYTALPQVEFSQNENACLQIQAPLISEETVITNDVVDLLSPTSFKLLGRIDNVINTGGIKVHPEIVEEKLAMHIAQPFFIASEKDEVLGEKIVLIIESQEELELNTINGMSKVLSKYEKPKKVLILPKFVYTETGKIHRPETLKLVFSFPEKRTPKKE